MISDSISKGSILIIDDNLFELRIMVSMLKNVGYKIIIANNGNEGLARALVLAPDLILCDVRMPDMSGYAVLRRLKSDSATKAIPVIFLTACNDSENRIEGLKLGAVDYIGKPANEEEVLLRIALHLRTDSVSFSTRTETDNQVQVNLSKDESILAACEKLINSDLSISLTIDQIADAVGTHRKRLTDIFKNAYGNTVYGYIREMRMQKACEFLKNDNLSVQSISDMLSFTSAANFATAFKDRFGASPSQFRKHLLGTVPELTSHLREAEMQDLTDFMSH